MRPINRIYLSKPHMSGDELAAIQDAFKSNWIAPVGPDLDLFEKEFADVVGANHALAVSSGTAALHLALRLIGIQPGDEVLVSTLTFVASVNPILYERGTPVFIDSEYSSWNMDPNLLADALRTRSEQGKLPKAVVLVHLYGQSANLDAILPICQEYGVPLVEDAAEALGSRYREIHPGSSGIFGAFSFNGNKIITTSGGGMLVSNNEEYIAHARKLATQAREPFPHYEHSELGFNYRLSNLLAAMGRKQLQHLDERVAAKRLIFERYRDALSHLPGIRFMPEAEWGKHTRWLTCITINEDESGTSRETIRLALELENIESRPLWKPMHMQPLFDRCEIFGGSMAEQLFADGLCLPSSSSMSECEQIRVIEIIKNQIIR